MFVDVLVLVWVDDLDFDVVRYIFYVEFLVPGGFVVFWVFMV